MHYADDVQALQKKKKTKAFFSLEKVLSTFYASRAKAQKEEGKGNVSSATGVVGVACATATDATAAPSTSMLYYTRRRPRPRRSSLLLLSFTLDPLLNKYVKTHNFPPPTLSHGRGRAFLVQHL